MKTPLLSIEPHHAPQFRKFIFRLVQKFDPLQILSFSSSSSIQNNQGCFNSNDVSFRCNYCLLLVTESTARIDYEVQDFANTAYQQGLVTIICHSKQSIQDAIQQKSRFFISIITDGKLLYSKDDLVNIAPIAFFDPTHGANKALKHYTHRLPLAEGFLLCASECLKKEHYGICLFMLHQAVEQICIFLIRVHIGYRSEFHNLYRLLRLCLSFSDQPYQLFLATPEAEKLFNVMAKSYSGARYKKDFTVSQQDAETLYHRAQAFFSLAKTMCNEKIELLAQQAELHVLNQPKNESCAEIS